MPPYLMTFPDKSSESSVEVLVTKGVEVLVTGVTERCAWVCKDMCAPVWVCVSMRVHVCVCVCV